jgi:hypothetical protein
VAVAHLQLKRGLLIQPLRRWLFWYFLKNS